MLTSILRRSGALTAAAAVLAALAVPAAAHAEWANVYISDGSASWGATGSESGVWEPPTAPSLDAEILRGGVVVAEADREPVYSFPGGSVQGYVTRTDFAIQPGDVLRVFDATTGVDRVTVTHTGEPAIEACEGSATFSGTRPAGLTNGLFVQAHTQAAPDGGIPALGMLTGTVTSQSGLAFSGTFDEPLPDGHYVSASAWGIPVPETQVTISVRRLAEELCPAP